MRSVRTSDWKLSYTLRGVIQDIWYPNHLVPKSLNSDIWTTGFMKAVYGMWINTRISKIYEPFCYLSFHSLISIHSHHHPKPSPFIHWLILIHPPISISLPIHLPTQPHSLTTHNLQSHPLIHSLISYPLTLPIHPSHTHHTLQTPNHPPTR